MGIAALPPSYGLSALSCAASISGSSFSNRKFVEPDQSDLPAMANQIRAFGLRQIDPTGESLLISRNRVKPLLQKYFASLPTQISSLIRTVSFRQEGRIARRHETRDGMRWTRRRQASNSEPDE